MRRWMCSVILALGLWPLAGLANPFSSLTLRPIAEIPSTGRIVKTIDGGDYVLPRFSPDARYLAFSRVVLQGRTELTEIQLLDLKTFEVKVLLDARASLEYAIRSSFVTGISWNDATTLKAGVSDGDVNGVDLIFNVSSGKLIAKKPFSLMGEDAERQRELTPELAAAFPAIPKPVLANALVNGFRVGPQEYVVQKNYWKEDNHVWYLNAGRQEMKKLIDIPEAWIYSLRGGFVLNKAFLLLVAHGPEAWLVQHAGGKLELMYRFPVTNYQQTGIRVVHARGDRVLFQVNTGAPYERRENYLFVYDKNGLKRIVEAAPIYDLDVDASGALMCLSQWTGDRRRLVVRELKELR